MPPHFIYLLSACATLNLLVADPRVWEIHRQQETVEHRTPSDFRHEDSRLCINPYSSTRKPTYTYEYSTDTYFFVRVHLCRWGFLERLAKRRNFNASMSQNSFLGDISGGADNQPVQCTTTLKHIGFYVRSTNYFFPERLPSMVVAISKTRYIVHIIYTYIDKTNTKTAFV